MRRPAVLLVALVTTLVLGVLAALVGVAVVAGGLYDVASTTQHFQPTHTMLETAMRQSVRLRARDIAEPPLADTRMALRGAGCFRDHCVQCHGAPGVAPEGIGKSMQPLPGPLVDARRHWRPRELYWLTRHGIRMSGMPAWDYRLTDAQLWELVAFMQVLPDLGAADYADWTRRAPPAPACGPTQQPAAMASASSAASTALPAAIAPVASTAPTASTTSSTPATASARSAPTAADAARGRAALSQYACNACHRIPGVTGSDVHVGPPLAGIGGRQLIAGRLANTQENMARWITHTQQLKPGTAMPQMGVSERDARDIAAYLATLR